MKYQKSYWFEQCIAYAALVYVPPGAGKMAEDLSYSVLETFQNEPYTYVKIEHCRNQVTYCAWGQTICLGTQNNGEPDVFDPAWGIEKAILRAKRKIAKRLVWERDGRTLLEAAGDRLAAFRAEYYALSRKVHQAEDTQIMGTIVTLS